MSVSYSNRTVAQPAVEEIPPPSLPMYLASLTVTLCGLLAAGLALYDTGFVALIIGLAVVGYGVSFFTRQQSVHPRSIAIPGAILCACLLLIGIRSDQLIPLLAPTEAAENPMATIPVMLSWLAVFLSFVLVSDSWLLFACVPTIALFGVVGPMTTDGSLVLYFGVAVTAASFMLVHENFLRTRRTRQRSSRRFADHILFAGQVQIAAACGLGAIFLAWLASPLFEAFGSFLPVRPLLVTSRPPAADRTVTTPTHYMEMPELTMGGASPHLSNEVVMRVKAPYGSYWRGATFNKYAGRSWQNTLNTVAEVQPQPSSEAAVILGDSPPSTDHTFRIAATPYTQAGRGSHRLHQRFHLVGRSVFNQVYAAPECRVVELEAPRIGVDGAGAITVEPAIQSQFYEVDSDVPDDRPETLRKAPPNYPAEIVAHYLKDQTDIGTPIEQVRQTAEEVTRGAPTVYDKVEALKEWVGRQCKYNSESPAVPPGAEVVTYFLFTGKQGDCNSFGTALAILCRSIGIPARVATGFIPGVFDPQNGEYQVHDKDRHLWTEVYFPNSGWIRFDATEDAQDISSNDDLGVRKASLTAFLFQRGWLPPVALLLFAGLLGFVLKTEVWDRYRPRRSKAQRLGMPETNLDILSVYEDVCRMLGRRGQPRPLYVTPSEYVKRLKDSAFAESSTLDGMDQLTHLVNRFRYSGEAASTDHVRQARVLEAVIRAGLKRRAPSRALSAVTGSP